MAKELSELEFKNTFGNKMTDVTETAKPMVDIWDYVEELVRQNLVEEHIFKNNLVEKVYRNNTSTFDHVLLPTENKNVFITLVVDLCNKTLLGHIN
ncbi:hypothetical protein BH11BAC6_BH11BAC6_15050 [soil metagenome]